ncbi:unnamed protein product [Linum trigynum]|uniref:F-box domain-containing protein n=1 Tax=Linum trigynum TaxID=586398 RepID=A0AAV2FFY1_9ROSI
MSDEIPEELITGILSKLQVSSSIARFRCVCKSWRRLLSDPSFIRKNNLASSASDHQFMVEWTDRTGDVFRHVHRLISPDTLEPLLPSPLQLPFDQNRPRRAGDCPSFSVVGCCNGLLCIVEYRGRKDEDLILWNPATSEFRVLPPSPVANPSREFLIGAVGFGFDSERDDYRIVRQFFFDELGIGRRHYISEVYSLRNNCWWRLPDGGCPLLGSWRIPQCRKGKMYWWRSTGQSKGLVFDSFDIASELFEVVEVHYDSEKPYDTPNCLLNEESMVAVFPEYYEENQDEYGDRKFSTSWDVWVLLKYWVSESWMKLYVVTSPPGMIIESCVGLSSGLKYFFNTVPTDMVDEHGDYSGDRSLIPFHLETGEFGDVLIEGICVKVITNYVPSRVSLQDYLPQSPNIISNVSDFYHHKLMEIDTWDSIFDL